MEAQRYFLILLFGSIQFWHANNFVDKFVAPFVLHLIYELAFSCNFLLIRNRWIKLWYISYYWSFNYKYWLLRSLLKTLVFVSEVQTFFSKCIIVFFFNKKKTHGTFAIFCLMKCVIQGIMQNLFKLGSKREAFLFSTIAISLGSI